MSKSRKTSRSTEPKSGECTNNTIESANGRPSDSTTELIDLVPSAATGDEFIQQICGGEVSNLLDGLSRLLTWYVYFSNGRHVAVTSSDLDSEFVRLPGAVGDLMRAIDPRTLGAVNHMMAESLNQGKTIEQAIKYVIDEAYNRFCQIVPSRERGH